MRFGLTCFFAKSDAVIVFQRCLGDVRDNRTPSTVECVRNDKGGEFATGAFKDLCDERGIRQEIPTADTPKLNGVVEGGLGLVQEAARATWLEASRLLPVHSSRRLIILGLNHAFKCARPWTGWQTTENAFKSPYELCYGGSFPS